MYLLENHCGTSYQQLCNGCDNLRSEVERSRAAPGKFIKDNLDSFIKCYDTLSDILLYTHNYPCAHKKREPWIEHRVCFKKGA